MSTHDEARSSDHDETIPQLKLVECVPPSVAEIIRAADSAEEPNFLLRLNRPLSADERRVVALELPNATLHDNGDPHLTLSVDPDHVIERPHALQTIVQGISSVTITMRRAEVELLAECEGAALAVNELLRPAETGALPSGGHDPSENGHEQSENGHGPSKNGHEQSENGHDPASVADARATRRARRRPLRA
jgi:hypothetical protein